VRTEEVHDAQEQQMELLTREFVGCRGVAAHRALDVEKPAHTSRLSGHWVALNKQGQIHT
jgi:hypothetical protein